MLGNYINYFDEYIKISNISRTLIYKYENREKEAYDRAVMAYEENKRRFMMDEMRKKKEKIFHLNSAMVFLFLISLFCFSLDIFAGMIVLIGSVVCGYLAYYLKKKPITYSVSPPKRGSFPDKYGLSIELNSGSSIVFTAIGKDGVKALRDLQKKIYESDERHEIINFNMNEYHVTAESNDGIINVGDTVNSTYNKEG